MSYRKYDSRMSQRYLNQNHINKPYRIKVHISVYLNNKICLQK